MIVNLTQMGRRKAKDIMSKGPEQTILASLEEHGPASLEELSKDLSIDLGTLKAIAAKLANQGLIKKEE